MNSSPGRSFIRCRDPCPRSEKSFRFIPARSFPSKLGQEEFLRVNLGQVGDKVIANPLPRGAGTITSLTRADGIIRIPENVEGLNLNEPVPAELLRDEQVIARTVVIVGSHDNTLDLLGNFFTLLLSRVFG